jgi:hypothetical protein
VSAHRKKHKKEKRVCNIYKKKISVLVKLAESTILEKMSKTLEIKRKK